MTEREQPKDHEQSDDHQRLEQAIAALEAQRATLGDAVVDASIAALRREMDALAPPLPAEQPLEDRRQRKQITILFADVPGFTAMSETMDAEEIGETMNALWTRLDQVIANHGGTIDKHMGDGVMAVWGAEAAREDDPERAIRAALAMQSAVRDFNAEARPAMLLQMRIGINTGPVLLGTVGTTGEYTAMGDAVNTANRLEQAASTNEILISHDTYRHVWGIFDVQPLDPIQVRGKIEPVQVYIVQRAKPRAFRLDRRGVEGIETRMIGRDAELQCLQDVLRATVENSERQLVTVVGEAGVGKSRLLAEFDDWVELLPERIRYFKGRASPAMQHQPYALVRDLFSFRFQIQDSDRARTVRRKVEAGVGEALGMDAQGRMRAHFIGQLLGFDFSASPYLQGVLDDAQQLRNRALFYLSEFFQATADLDSTAIFLEDIHWADDSSLDVIDHLARTTAGHRLLFIGVARPPLFERRPHWGEGWTLLELQPLSKSDSRRLVEEILQKVEEVPASLCELVVDGAEGNPFYLEELIKMLIEDGVIVKGEDRWRVQPARLTTVRVPPTLTGVLQARLDSLPVEERLVLQQASVVGRTFWDSAVVRINKSTEGFADRATPTGIGVPDTLSALAGKEMVFRQDPSAFAGTQEYTFKHAILREVTYESVLRRVRRLYHALVAEWLIEHSGERVREYTGLIADHLELAERTEQAVTYLYRAGEQAAAQFANAEAVNYFSRALGLIPDPTVARAKRYTLLLARERVYDIQGAREAQAQDVAALDELVSVLEDDEKQTGLQIARRRAELALRQANYAQVTSDFPAAIAATRTAIAQAQAAQDVPLEAAGYLQWGLGLWRLGDFEMCRVQLERALALAQAAGSRRLEAESLRILGNVYYYQGDYARATVYWEQSLPISREIGDRPGEASTLSNLGEAARSQGNYAGARTYYEQRLHICRDTGDRWGEVIAILNLGLISHNLGDNEASREYSRQVLQHAQEIDSRIHQGYALTNLGYALAELGHLAEAIDAYQQALALRREVGEYHLAMESLAGLARAYLAQGDLTQALSQVEEILGYLGQEGNSLDGTEEPLRVYLTCYRVLRASQDPRARDVLAEAHRLLQERAVRITDEELRRSFLENVAAHREIRRAFAQPEGA